MEIKEIKSLLSIERVLAHYGLNPDKNHRLRCPFHPDKTPSLQIYPATNTYCCFSSNCTAGTGDQIQFIQLKENCNKHEALVKAASLLHGNTIVAAEPVKLFIETAPFEKIAVVTKLFKYFSKALPLTKRAVDYLKEKSLDYKLHDTGYNTGDWHYKLNEKNFMASCMQYGLLKEKPAGGFTPWAKDCIIFPLKNQEGKIISLYGRSTTNDKEQRHFYLTGRSGLYPGYPSLQTKKLILTESIIDAISLLQQETIKVNYEILSLYGTNGLTDEHIAAITSLPQLEEIILMLNGDEAGESATARHYQTLRNLLPEIKLTHVVLPDGEDVNSLLQSHDDPKILIDLIEQRKVFFFSIEKKNTGTLTTSVLQTSKLNTSNNELLIYDMITVNCILKP